MGAHALVLQERGHQVTALDPIPEAVRIMQERGVDDAREGTLFELPSGEIYDTVILLMNGSMIAETLSGLDRLLALAFQLDDGQMTGWTAAPCLPSSPVRRTRTQPARSGRSVSGSGVLEIGVA